MVENISPRADEGLFGMPAAALVEVPDGAEQFSPLHPGSTSLAEVAAGTLKGMTMLAAPGTLERRHDLALMLRARAPDAPFTVLAPKDGGGSRLGSELGRFGCETATRSKAHHRICTGRRPSALTGTEEAIADGGPRRLPGVGLWSQPGIFSWDRLDAGTALLLDTLPARLSGRGADLGCGIGLLAHHVLASEAVTSLDLVDSDRRAVEAARRNVDDPRVRLHWADIRDGLAFASLDFVVTNPPFHDGGREDRTLGPAFIRRAAEALRPGGHLWLVANRHLPYEPLLKTFRRADAVIEANGYKVLHAVR
jgi:16S rRNA (guanine1207-N2)-methyltransferase